jgi:hypothetical protein
MITIFANFRINDEQRFQNLKKSFFSFYKSNINNWIINIRGNKKNEVRTFFEKNILQKFKITHLESQEGWLRDSKELCSEELSNYIFCWNEDHVNMVSEQRFNNYVQQIIDNNIDQFVYSWFHLGELPKSFEISALRKKDDLYILDDYNYYNHKERLKLIKEKKYCTVQYLISLIGIFKKEFFLEILNTDDPLLKRWDKKTPFDFEKAHYDIHWLPFRYACPKEEFFACIDDDHGQENYCINNRVKKTTNSLNVGLKFKNKNIFILIFKLFRYPIFKIWVFIREIINKRNSINKFQKKL